MSDKRNPRPTLAADFNATTPAAVARALNNKPALQALRSIDNRSIALKERAIAHHKSFEDRWTMKEMIRISNRQRTMNQKYPGPKGFVPQVDENDVYKLAVRQMTARLNRRLTKINEIKTRMSNAVVRNIDPSLTQEFNRGVRLTRRKKMEI